MNKAHKTSIEKRNKINAWVSDDTLKAIKKGAAVFNNGLRSPEGYFFPDQPEFSLGEDESDIKNLIVISTVCYIAKNLTEKLLIPVAQQHFLNKKEKESQKNMSLATDTVDKKESSDNIIDFSQFKKKAV